MEANEFDILELKDGTNYVIADRVTLNNINYAFLINKNDNEDIMFQRISYEGDIPKLSPIGAEEEFDIVLKYFGEKYKDLLENI